MGRRAGVGSPGGGPVTETDSVADTATNAESVTVTVTDPGSVTVSAADSAPAACSSQLTKFARV
jgi:hypothetical protein